MHKHYRDILYFIDSYKATADLNLYDLANELYLSPICNPWLGETPKYFEDVLDDMDFLGLIKIDKTGSANEKVSIAFKGIWELYKKFYYGAWID